MSSKSLNIALIGPPGAGKGTHVGPLEEHFDLLHISTGDLFRRNLIEHTTLGDQAVEYMKRGELVPDDLVDAMMAECLEKFVPERSTLIDGFPRTLHQAAFLDRELQALGTKLDGVIYLDASDDVIVERATGRIICVQCQAPYHVKFRPPAQEETCDLCGGRLYKRPDDHPKPLNARLKTYHRESEKLIDYYLDAHKVTFIDSVQPIPAVEAEIIEAIEAFTTGNWTPATASDLEGIRRKRQVKAPKPELIKSTLDLVLIGGPGSGKGTQSEFLCEEFKLPHVATGDLFREHFRNNTELGKIARTYTDRGELVPDALTEAMVAERLALPDVARGFLLDGFPRALHQAHALIEMEADMHRRLTGALYIDVPDDELVDRISGRLICTECQAPFHKRFKPPATEGKCDQCDGELYQRSDDNPKTVRARLKTFHLQTKPVAEYFEELGLLHRIDGMGEVKEIADRLIGVARELSDKVRKG